MTAVMRTGLFHQRSAGGRLPEGCLADVTCACVPMSRGPRESGCAAPGSLEVFPRLLREIESSTTDKNRDKNVDASSPVSSAVAVSAHAGLGMCRRWSVRSADGYL